MDKQDNKILDEKDSTKVFDLDEANIIEEDNEDIDTLYEANEVDESKSDETKASDEPTRLIPSTEDSKKDKKKKSKKDKEKKREERLKEKNSKKLDKLMKKKKKREDNSDREVLSYEDMPLEEREESKPQKKKRKSHKKSIIIVLLILVILFGAVFIFASTDKLSWHNIRNYVKYGVLNQKSDESFPISVQGENVDIGNFTRMGQDVCYASDTKFQIVNNYGRHEYSAQHGFLNPVMKASSDYALIYSLGGTGYQICDDEKSLFTSEAEDRIVTGAINDSGTYAIVTTSNGYLSKMQVYDKNNEKIFGYSFADYYVTAVSIAPNGKSAAVTGVSALNGSEISAFYYLDFTKDKPVYQSEEEENLYYDCQFLNDTYACAVGTALSCTVNIKSGDVNTLNYEGKNLTCYCFNHDTDTYAISLSRSGDGRNCEIYSFNTNGTVDASFETEYMVKGISSYKNRVALLTQDVIYLYTENGDKVSEKEASNDPRAIVLYTSDDAYVLDTNEINAIRI